MSRRLTRKRLGTLLSLAVIVAAVVITRPDLRDRLGQAATSSQPGLYTVVNFVDGDTISVNMNGQPETIRFIGVDTPETHKPKTPVQCYGPQAAAFTKQTINHQKVRLTADPLDTNRDRYGRLLRYVSLPDGTLINAELIKQGYGFYYPYFPFSRKAEFAAYGQQARQQQKGLWSVCHPQATSGGGYLSNPL